MLWDSRQKTVAALSSLGYLLYYVLFTGIIQQVSTGGYTIAGTYFKLVNVESVSYSGLGLQLITGSTIISLKVGPLILSVVMATLFGINIALFYFLYRRVGLRACFYGGIGGAGAIFASFASFSYLCCGWALPLVLIGSTLLATFSMAIAIGSIALLTFSAFILWKRTQIVK